MNGGAGASGSGMDVEAVMQGGAFWDDVRGGWLDKDKVREARMEELTFMQKEHLWDVVPRSRAKGHRVVSVRWVDTNKGSPEAPEVRCRWWLETSMQAWTATEKTSLPRRRHGS